MRLEDVTAEIRPRSDWEAVDLGIALVRRGFWRLAGLWLLAMVPVAAAAVALRAHPFWWLSLWWWCKPVGARLALFDLSRGLFGERVGGRGLWRRALWVWRDRPWVWLAGARLSPRRLLAMAVADLEGLRGAVLRERVRVVRRRGDGAVFGLSLAALFLQGWLGLAVFALAALFVPEGQGEKWSAAFELWAGGEAVAPPLLLGWTLALALAPAVMAVDLFATGAVFGLYLNNRSWIEGWDVELAFKRLAERLRRAGLAAAVAAVAAALWPGPAEAEGVARDEARARERATAGEVLAGEQFRVHKERQRLWEPRQEWRLPEWLRGPLPGGLLALRQLAGTVLLGAALLVAAVGAAWLLRRYRRRGGPAAAGRGAAPAVVRVAGIEISPQDLPDDPPAVALAWWRGGRRREALGLLYRAAIVALVERRHLEIGPAATEEDCVRRVAGSAAAAEADHFRRLTLAWILQAYAGRSIREEELAALCAAWPYRGEVAAG